jgi:hypothetical protein
MSMIAQGGEGGIEVANDSPNDDRRQSQSRVRKTLSNENACFKLDELSEPRLLLRICEIATSRTEEASVWNICLLRRLDQLHRDVELVLVSRGDEAERIAVSLLQCLDHLSRLAGLVSHNFGAELDQCLAFSGGWVKGEAGDRIDLLGENGICEKEFGDEIAGLAVDRRDADVARRHLSSRLVVGWNGKPE